MVTASSGRRNAKSLTSQAEIRNSAAPTTAGLSVYARVYVPSASPSGA